MVIIEKATEFVTFIKSYSNEEKVFIHPIFTDHKRHPLDNNLSLLYVRFFSGDRYMLVFNHSEGLPLNPQCIGKFQEFDTKIYTVDKKFLSHIFKFSATLHDTSIKSYLAGKDVPEFNYETKTHSVMYTLLRMRPNLNRIIPLVKHFEMCEFLADDVIKNMSDNVPKKVYDFYNNLVIPVFTKIEEAGLKTHDKYFYTEYNLFTSTGRPSNRFGGLNFAALNKTDGSRKKFISRFKNGGILIFDYEAYHLRLIANIINFPLPSGSVHTFLGQQYFDKTDLTNDEYAESKRISFKFLYGKIHDDIATAIPYFRSVKNYVDKLWDEINVAGYIESPISGRRIFSNKINNLNSTKLFNYQIQLLETEKNCLTLVKIHKFIEKYETELILYVYDSYIFDVNMSDGKNFFKDLKTIIECAGRFPTKTYIGQNYDTVKDVTF